MTEQLDAQGEAREALSTMVTDYSKRILSDPRMLGNVVTDLLPDLPRERRLLVTAAESDVAGELTRHVEEHHLDPDTAVQLVARSLTDRTALDPAASTWVTAEYAQALGYRRPCRSRRPPRRSIRSPATTHMQGPRTRHPRRRHPRRRRLPDTRAATPALPSHPGIPHPRAHPRASPRSDHPSRGHCPGSPPSSHHPRNAIVGPSSPPPAPRWW
jgi:hypothetical protein